MADRSGSPASRGSSSFEKLPLIKSYVARPRPIARDPTLIETVSPLDVYSCPSGHVMSAVAVFIPLSVGYPGVTSALSVLAVLIGWGRLALGHHYPTDIILGALLGATITIPLTLYFLL